DNGVWKWPRDLSMKFDGLNAIEPPCLTEGRLSDFSGNTVWNDLRFCSDTVPWVKIVWYSQCIPMHAFMVWLAIHGRLRTQDLMVKWEKYGDMRCVFCKKVPNSHDHLFFECEFSKKVWDCLKCMARMDHASDCCESNDPPDPLLDELYSLTKMTSAKEIRDASLNATK
nr:hypothetical protein [Tanacetum cinerariifolium]